MDGQIVIGTEVDTKNLAKGLKDAEAMLKQFERESEGLEKAKLQAEQDISESTYGVEYLKEATQESLNLATTEEERKEILAENNRLINLATIGLEEFKKEYADINDKIVQNKENQEAIRKKISEINEEMRKAGALDNINGKLKQIGNSIDHTAGKMVRWGLAILGVRGAVMLVRRAISMVSADNDVVAAQLQQMRNVIAAALYPIVSTIVNLIAKIMFYVNTIFKALTGKNLFNFSAAMKNGAGNLASGAKSAGKMAKNLKDAKNQLAGFDEMNVLNDTSSSSGGDVGGGGAGDVASEIPNIFDQFKDMKIPSWMQWLIDNGDLVIAILAGLAGGLAAIKLGFEPIQALGIGLMFSGIAYAIEGVIDYLKDPSWENFGKVIEGIGLFVIGLGVAFLGLPAIITGVVILILGVIIKYWDKIKEILQKGIDWLKGKSDSVYENFGLVAGMIYDLFVGLLQGLLNGLDTLFKFFKSTFDLIIQFVKNVFAGNWKAAWENVKQIFKNIFSGISAIASSILGTVLNTVKNIAVKVGSAVGSSLKAAINAVLSWIEKQLNKPISAINSLIEKINSVPGISLGRLSSIRLPRLAKGGIINQPSRGVAVGGEAGMEGVIPLTDSQQMRILGETIGRYITINFTNVNSMNGRVISREMKKIDNDNAFASNR